MTSLEDHLTNLGEDILPHYLCPITGRQDAAFGMSWIADDPDFDDLQIAGPDGEPVKPDFVSNVLVHQRRMAGQPLVAGLSSEGWPAECEVSNQARAFRLQRLMESDWTQMNDNGMDENLKSAWATYRQALRDLPQTFADPNDIEWPIKP